MVSDSGAIWEDIPMMATTPIGWFALAAGGASGRGEPTALCSTSCYYSNTSYVGQYSEVLPSQEGITVSPYSLLLS